MLEAEWRALDADFAFVAECNEGGEFMAPERVARLKAIAARTWTRTLDDRIGDRARRAQAQGTQPGATAAGGRAAARRQARASDRAPAGGPDGRGQPLGIPGEDPGAALQPRRALQPVGGARHAVGGGALQDQRAHHPDDHDALGAAVPAAPAARARDRRRPSREDGRHRLSEAAQARRDEPGRAHDGDRRHLRGAHRRRPAVQEGEDAVGGDQDHGRSCGRTGTSTRSSSSSS